MENTAIWSECKPAWTFLNVDDPLVAWLVYRGEMVSAPAIHERAMSFWFAKLLRGAVGSAQRIETELRLDALRHATKSEAVSRLRGFYAFADRASAELAAQRWQGGFRLANIEEVGIKPGSRVSRYDSAWITHEFGNADGSWMPHYLAGEAHSTERLDELLVDGRAYVFGTELRQRAYETVKRTWPLSLGTLELARVAALLDSDLGLITALSSLDERGFAVRYAMNFVDADEPEFLKRLTEFDGERNTADLNANSELVMPDLRSREFRLV